MIGAWPLAGRDAELRLIKESTNNESDGSGIVIAGPTGVGKTRLANEALDRAGAHKRPVHRFVATETSRCLPFGAFAEVAGSFGPDPMHRLNEVVEALGAASWPVRSVVGVDDAHLLDDHSALVVHQLVHQGLATVILTLRSGTRSPDAVTALWKDRHLGRLDLRPLSLTDTSRLLESALGDPIDSFSAQRLWAMTQGNALYLRHLVEDELASGHLKCRSGIWVWAGPPVISPGLGDLVDARLGETTTSVRAVVDLLAVGEPLQVELLRSLTDADSVESAEASGLIAVSTVGSQCMARLGHPMFGEVRRARAGPVRLRRLRGTVAQALARPTPQDDRSVVRRAVLALESDLTPDATLTSSAADCAMRLLDASLAERLARSAAEIDGTFEARFTHGLTLATLARGDDADRVLAQLEVVADNPDRAIRVAALRAAVLLWLSASPTESEAVLRRIGDDVWVRSPSTRRAISRSIQAVQARPRDAVTPPWTDMSGSGSEFDAMMSIWGLVVALGDLGRVAEIDDVAKRGYELAASSFGVAHLRFGLGVLHSSALALAGRLSAAATIADRLTRDSMSIPGPGQIMSAALAGHSALMFGRVETARRCLEEVHLHSAALGARTPLRLKTLAWLVEAATLSGHRVVAHDALEELNVTSRRSHLPFLDASLAVARAWAAASDGDTARAITLLRDAAEVACKRAQFAHEVHCLQTATRFGDRTTARRLSTLARVVTGPRAPAAALHATALATGDGTRLDGATRVYESFGDNLAAADCAAQASAAHSARNLAGSALTSSTRARRLATLCEDADTPALREVTEPDTLTPRQREIVRMVAQGMSNREIADRLVVSVRTVEGHVYRAAMKVNATSRTQLGNIVTGGDPPATEQSRATGSRPRRPVRVRGARRRRREHRE